MTKNSNESPCRPRQPILGKSLLKIFLALENALKTSDLINSLGAKLQSKKIHGCVA